MRIESVCIKNFRAAANVTLSLDGLTAIVGANGSGKTTILEALDGLFNGANFGAVDHTKASSPIMVSATLSGIPNRDDPLTVTRVWKTDCGYTGNGELHSNDPSISEQDILNSITFIIIRAIPGHDSYVIGRGELDLSIFVQQNLCKNASTQNIDQTFQSQQSLDELVSQLGVLQSRVNQRLCDDGAWNSGYASGSKVMFVLESHDTKRTVKIKFMEGDKIYDYAAVSHGTRRAYSMAAMEAHARMLMDSDSPSLILIDEPELHQHPLRQRHILETFHNLTGANSCQIVYTTNSPSFVDTRSLSNIYKLTRSQLVNDIVTLRGHDREIDVLNQRLPRYVADVVFSNGVILVEGLQDIAVFDAIFSIVSYHGKTAKQWLSDHGIGMISCDSVYEIPRFIHMFRVLETPMFVIWDADKHSSQNQNNNRILSLLNIPTFCWNSEPICSECYVGDDHACFACDCCLYFQEYLRSSTRRNIQPTKASIKRRIKNESNLVHYFNNDKFRKSDFATRIVPHILNRFLVSDKCVRPLSAQPSVDVSGQDQPKNASV